MSSRYVLEFEKHLKKSKYKTDQTPYIEKYEAENQPFVICLRPLGFDSVNFLTMMQLYFDEGLHQKSQYLFKGSYIQNKRSIHSNTFQTVRFDFSSLEKVSMDGAEEFYCEAINLGINDYLSRYPSILSDGPFSLQPNVNPVQSLSKFFAQLGNRNTFLLIREYRGFHREILEDYTLQFGGQTRFNPIIRHIYKTIKDAQFFGYLTRVFAVGIDDTADR